MESERLVQLREQEAKVIRELEQIRVQITEELQGGARVRVSLGRGLKSFRDILTTYPGDPRIQEKELGDRLVMAYHDQTGEQPAYGNDTQIWVAPADAEWLKHHPESSRYSVVDSE